MILNFITWNVDPEIFSIGPLTVRWYGLLWAVGILLALEIVKRIYKSEKLSEKWLDSLFMYTVIGTIAGARLGHIFFYEWKAVTAPVEFLGMELHVSYWNYYLSHPLEILAIWHGGLASHGGAIGILIAMYLYNKKVSKKGFLWVMDRLVIGAALTGAAIRLGNLMNSEIYGSVTSIPWGFIFVNDPQGDGLPHHPTQIYEMLYCLITFAIIWWMYWKKGLQKQTGLIYGVFLLGIFGSRFILEFIKLDQEAFESGMLLNMGQILSLPFIIWGLWLILRKNKTAISTK